MSKENQEQTKKCKHCQLDIPKKAKVCPHCRKKQKAPVLATILILFGILVFIGAIAGTVDDSSNNSNDDVPNEVIESSPVVEDDGYATMDKFKLIETEMTYKEVVEIMGSEGTLMSETAIGDVTSKLYCWYAKNGIANMNITFSNDKVLSKAQVALK